ncbi:DUF190 domain-containing protein [Acinetobacter sp. C26M]|uniref:DUF190 domain-containing protein n=1 Tax=unclassified Acinetobacter TaxID=196816 RepID=UPI00203703C0|nr:MULTISPECIES: DUF190 domain-containing protein [unclassified Acinetobacter]USA45000.1 DUF190 domain-containing protein [Acinetobacter sp. C26M]USA48503.1 DUF190 domain-containing protein [Acinetobacter sp. C26G]
MKGSLLKFYLEENKLYKGKQLYEWLIETAKSLGLRGVTVNSGVESFDRQGHLHSAHFFELADRPIQLEFVLDTEQEILLFSSISQENISLFYTKTAIEFGSVGNKENNNV